MIVMKYSVSLILTLFALLTFIPGQAEAQVARVRIDIGGPTVHAFSYRAGLLTIRPARDVVVVRKRAVKNGHVIVYKDRPDYVLKAHHSDFVAVGFSRVSVKKRGRRTTVVYQRGNERVRLVVKPYRKTWEAHIVAI